jgi:hypothetical protein
MSPYVTYEVRHIIEQYLLPAAVVVLLMWQIIKRPNARDKGLLALLLVPALGALLVVLLIPWLNTTHMRLGLIMVFYLHSRVFVYYILVGLLIYYCTRSRYVWQRAVLALLITAVVVHLALVFL